MASDKQTDPKQEDVEEQITRAYNTLSPEDQELFSDTRLIHTDRDEDVQTQVYHVVRLRKRTEQRKRHVMGLILGLMILGIAGSAAGLMLRIRKAEEKAAVAASAPSASLDTEVTAVNAAAFPDEGFRKRILASADSDGDSTLSSDEIRSVVMINYSGDDTIRDVRGIGTFTSLQYLNLSGTNVTAIDLSKNTDLTTLNVSGTGITSLDLTGLTSLSSLDIRNCTSLQELLLPQPSSLTEILSEGSTFACSTNNEDVYTACRIRN